MTKFVKTPVSIVEELSMTNGISPIYKLLQVEGKVHEPLFTIRLIFQNITVDASSKSKKLAKQLVANELLRTISLQPDLFIDQEKILRSWNPTEYDDKCSPTIGTITDTDSVKNDSVDFNAVGKLGEYCSKLKIPSAYYDDKEGPLNEENVKTFTVTCKLHLVGPNKETLTSEGTGLRKQIAKRNAAAAMYSKLEELDFIKNVFEAKKETSDGSPETEENLYEEETNPQVIHKRLMDNITNFTDDNIIGNLVTQISNKLNAAVEAFCDYFEILNNAIGQLGLSVKLEEFENHSLTEGQGDGNPYKCILHVTVKDNYANNPPIISAWGASNTKIGAISNAARRALELFCSARRTEVVSVAI